MKSSPGATPAYDINLIKLNAGMPLYQNAEKYLAVQTSCLTSRHLDHDIQQELVEATARLTAIQGSTLFERASSGDPEAILEMAVRSAFLFQP